MCTGPRCPLSSLLSPDGFRESVASLPCGGVSGARRGGTANTSTIGGKHTEKPRVGEFPGGAGRLPEAPHLWRAGPG